ncbi:unnamed protein product, partial [Gordionus sp. m RMFG-2023]
SNPKNYSYWKQEEMFNPIIPNENEIKNILMNLNLINKSGKLTENYNELQKIYLIYYYEDYYDFDYDYMYDINYPYETHVDLTEPHLYEFDFEKFKEVQDIPEQLDDYAYYISEYETELEYEKI